MSAFIARRLVVLPGLLAVCFAVFFAVPFALPAQGVRGIVVDRADRPLAGVVVTLLDGAGREVTRALTSDAGEYRLTAGTIGTYRLRALRIGFQPVLSPEIGLPTGTTVATPLVLDGIRAQLAGMRVTAQNSCGRRVDRSDDAVTTAWEQATGSLALASLGSTAGLTVSALVVERRLDGSGRRVRTQQASLRTTRVVDPWRSAPVAMLRQRGYVWVETNDSVSYFAPGLDVLLSPPFVEDHCLGLAVSSDSTEIAVSFEPIPQRRDLAEVRGTLWMSRETAELRRMEFEFVNVPGVPRRSGLRAGGSMSFIRLPTGAVLITNWEIRMPQFVRSSSTGEAVRVESVATVGGHIVTVRRGRDTMYQTAPMAVRGTVRDSASNRAVAGATVQIAGTGSRTTTEANGTFSIADVLPGYYTLVVRTPSLDSIGASDSLPVLVAQGAPDVLVRTTSAARWVARACGTVALADSAGRQRGAVAGTLRGGADSTARGDTPVHADWTQFATGVTTTIRSSAQRLETRAASDGSFLLCGVPVGIPVSVGAAPSGGRVEPVSVRLMPDRRIATVSLAVDFTRAAVATFSGTIFAAPETPVRDADVAMPGLGLSARTDSAGRFRISGVTPGTHEVVVRRVGFALVATSVDVGPNETVERRIAIRPLVLLDSVAVTSTRIDPMMSEFEANRRIGIGTFITRDMLARDSERALGSVLSQVPGVRLLRGAGNRAWLSSTRSSGGALGALSTPSRSDQVNGARAACYAKVYVDNVLTYSGGGGEPLFDVNSITVDRIEAVEYYAGAAETPARFGGLGAGCGVLSIHTRRER